MSIYRQEQEARLVVLMQWLTCTHPGLIYMVVVVVGGGGGGGGGANTANFKVEKWKCTEHDQQLYSEIYNQDSEI